MLVISNGMPRSASTWSYNVALHVLRFTQPDTEVYGAYDEDIAHFLDCVPQTAAHAVLKCHGLDSRGSALVKSQKAKVIYTWRDPADAVVSCMRMFDYDFERSLAAIDASLELYQLHRRSRSALLLDYQDIVSAPIDAIRSVAAFLEASCSSTIIETIAELTSLEHMRRRADTLNPEHMDKYSDLAYDPQTLLHRGHIHDGRTGYGRKALTREQAAQVDELLVKHSLVITG